MRVLFCLLITRCTASAAAALFPLQLPSASEARLPSLTRALHHTLPLSRHRRRQAVDSEAAAAFSCRRVPLPPSCLSRVTHAARVGLENQRISLSWRFNGVCCRRELKFGKFARPFVFHRTRDPPLVTPPPLLPSSFATLAVTRTHTLTQTRTFPAPAAASLVRHRNSRNQVQEHLRSSGQSTGLACSNSEGNQG